MNTKWKELNTHGKEQLQKRQRYLVKHEMRSTCWQGTDSEGSVSQMPYAHNARYATTTAPAAATTATANIKQAYIGI